MATKQDEYDLLKKYFGPEKDQQFIKESQIVFNIQTDLPKKYLHFNRVLVNVNFTSRHIDIELSSHE